MKFIPQMYEKLKKLRKSCGMHRLRAHTSHTGSALQRNATTSLRKSFFDKSKDIAFKETFSDYFARIDKLPKILSKSTCENFFYNGSFHEAIGKVLLFAQCFAIMPVEGVTSTHPKELKFSWWCWRTLYSLLFIVMTSFDTVLSFNKVLIGSLSFNNIEPLIFRFSILIVCISAINLARKWPEVMLYWYDVESSLPQYYMQRDKRHMAHQIRMVTIIAMMLSLGEHLLNIISNVHYSNYCPITKNPIKNFLLLTNDQIFYVFPYSYWLAILGKFQNILGTFVWNYMDVFVMIISIGLASKFEQLNDNLIRFKGMQMPESFWSDRRVQYRSLCNLCEKIDSAISVITMVSFSNNLYFICVQLLKSLNQMPSVAHALYFYYSLLFLIGRTLAVSLYSANINDESRKPLRILRCVPKESWGREAKRFAEEISSDLVALSGMKFFHLTRQLVLSVAGTIVTYELVLIQFREDSRLWDCVKKYPFVDINADDDD